MTASDPTGPVLVVVPAYNEAGAVGDVLRDLREHGYACVVVDDGSSDRTARVAREAGAPVLRLPFNLGVGGALRCGFRYAVDHGCTTVVQCDADGQHPADQIARLIAAAEQQDAHLAIGSRFLDGSGDYEVGRTRRFVMRRLAGIVRRSTGLRITDPTSGFRCIRRPLLDEFADSYPVHYLGDTFEAAIVAARAGYRVVEVPIEMRERAAGTSTARPLAAVTFVARAILAAVVGLGFRIRRFDPSDYTGPERRAPSRARS
jgi:glycosyltransferase involved in cell wall biosynthesis